MKALTSYHTALDRGVPISEEVYQAIEQEEGKQTATRCRAFVAGLPSQRKLNGKIPTSDNA